METNIRPIRNQVLIVPDMGDEMSAGGIIVPENLRKRCNRGKVVAVGSGTVDRDMRYRPQQTIWHIKDAGVELIEKGQKFILVPDWDILAYKEN